LLLRAISSFLLLPGIFAGCLPWLISEFDPWRSYGWQLGVLIGTSGLVMLLVCVREFHVTGKGTLAPWNPPRQLVTRGLYRYCRNPMYLAVLTIIAGWTLSRGSPLLLAYGFFAATAFHVRIVHYEEPCLAMQFPRQWQLYVDSVPRWLPKLPLVFFHSAGK